jgi:predicted DCC family thiol-disulfide oxidoreductase YuxK
VVPWAWRLAQVQVSICYLTTFLLKMPGTLWPNGTAIYYPISTPEFRRFPLPFVDAQHIWLINVLTYGTLAIELALGTLVWVPRLRLYVLAAGVLLHLGIEYSLNIPLFGWLMVTSYLSFIKQSDLNWLTERLPPRLRLGALRVVYDGECDFCRSALLVVRYLDVLRRVSFHDYHKPEELAAATGVTYEEADDAAVAVDDRDRKFAGFDAFRQIAWRTPALWMLVPLLYIPGVPPLGRRAYAWVAAHRKSLPVAPRYKPKPPAVPV